MTRSRLPSSDPPVPSRLAVARSSNRPRGVADGWAYPIDHHREGSYYVILFEAPATAIAELERGLLISEEVLRHLVTRVERPVRAARGHDGDADAEVVLPVIDDEEPEDEVELIDESETEAAPAAID